MLHLLPLTHIGAGGIVFEFVCHSIHVPKLENLDSYEVF